MPDGSGRWRDGLLGLPELRDEDLPPGFLVMEKAAELLGISPFDAFNSQGTPDGGQAYWRICREDERKTAMALVHGPGEHPVSADDALARLVRGPLAEVRAYLEGKGIDVAGDPMLKFAFRSKGDA